MITRADAPLSVGRKIDTDARFWRFENITPESDARNHFYIDPREIVSVDYGPIDDEDPEILGYYLRLRSGDTVDLSRADGEKMMRWAEAQAEPIPEPLREMAWARPG